MSVKLGQVDEIQVTHADGSSGIAKLRVIGVATNPQPSANATPQPATPESSTAADAAQ